MTEEEIRAHLTNLPAIFPEVGLRSCFEAVVEARADDYCVMDLLPRNSLKPAPCPRTPDLGAPFGTTG